MPETETLSALGLAALGYAERLGPVFPLQPGGKVPLTPHGYKDASRDPEQIAAWWSQWPDANIGLPCGEVVGFDVLDVDEKAGGVETLRRYEHQYGPLPATPLQLTGGGGLHYLFAHTPGLKNAAGLDGGLDLRTTGGYIVAAPSVHASGRPYAWDLDADPEDLSPAPWPDWLLPLLPRKEEKTFTFDGGPPAPPADADAVRTYALKALDDESNAVRQAPVGQQEATLNKAAYNVGQLVAAGALTEAEAYTGLMVAAAGMANDPDRRPWTESECEHKVRRGLRQGGTRPRDLSGVGKAKPVMGFVAEDWQGGQTVPFKAEPTPFGERHFSLTEYGNGDRFVHRWAAHVRHCGPLGGWMVWTGQCWALDSGRGPGSAGPLVMEMAKETTRAIGVEEKGRYFADDNQDKDLAVAWCRTSQTAQKTKNMLDLAASSPDIARPHTAFDMQPWVFNAANGSIDLQAGTFYEAERDDHLTQMAPVLYDRTARCPRWEMFLKSTFPHHPEIVPFLQRYLGYCLTGSVQEQKFVIFHGGGGNGKTTLFETISKMLGPYATAVNPSIFGDQPTGQAQKEYHLAMLRPTRFVVTAESDARRKLDEALVKRTTGGDRLVARNPHERPFTFYPEFKIILSTNHRPEVRGRDTGIWRRLVLVPFDIKFGEPGFPPKIPDLQDRLVEEWSGILNWLVRGCMEWQQSGLQVPDCVLEKTRQYKEEEDILGDFFLDCCVFEPGRQVLKRDLYKTYVRWCSGPPMHERTFNKEVGERGEEHGFRTGRNKVSTVWEGMGFSEEGQSRLSESSGFWRQN